MLPKGEACCGSLVHHMGCETRALAQARANIDVWTREIEGEGLDAILVTASGCGTTIKDYGFMLREDPAYAEKAARIAALAKDVDGISRPASTSPFANPSGLVVAYHSACSMQHGQKMTLEPKNLLRRAGFIVRDVPEGHICCGSAGTYNILQPEIAGRLRARKVANIARQAGHHRGRQYRLHHADREQARRFQSSTPPSCSTGPAAGPSRTGRWRQGAHEFQGIGPNALPFFKALAFHQTREWFEENRGTYETRSRRRSAISSRISPRRSPRPACR